MSEAVADIEKARKAFWRAIYPAAVGDFRENERATQAMDEFIAALLAAIEEAQHEGDEFRFDGVLSFADGEPLTGVHARGAVEKFLKWAEGEGYAFGGLIGVREPAAARAEVEGERPKPNREIPPLREPRRVGPGARERGQGGSSEWVG